MAVTKSQLPELLAVVTEELGPGGPAKFKAILTRFTTIQAYRSNKSFRDTVDSLLEMLKEN